MQPHGPDWAGFVAGPYAQRLWLAVEVGSGFAGGNGGAGFPFKWNQAGLTRVCLHFDALQFVEHGCTVDAGNVPRQTGKISPA